MTPENHEMTSIILSIVAGIGLSASCGFRIFIPLLITSISGYAGWIHIGSGFEWMGSLPAVILFGAATITEILAYCIPIVDHFLDIIGAPCATIAGILLSAAFMTDLPSGPQWVLALIAGGGSAFLMHAGTAKFRALSTLLTGGIANPIYALGESMISAVFAIMAIAVPLLLVFPIAFVAIAFYRRANKPG